MSVDVSTRQLILMLMHEASDANFPSSFSALCHGFLEGILEMVGLLMVALAIACIFSIVASLAGVCASLMAVRLGLHAINAILMRYNIHMPSQLDGCAMCPFHIYGFNETMHNSSTIVV